MQDNYYTNIKNYLIDNEITRKVKNYSINKSDLTTYYKVGMELVNAGKHYGEGIINEYSKRLTNEINKKYSIRLLYKMIKYYRYIEQQKVPTVSAKISWSHYDELLKLKDDLIITYYINLTEKQNLSVRELRQRIKSKEYERLPEETRNKISIKEENNITNYVKDPILIKNIYNYEKISKKILQKLILEDISSFMKELGTGYSFIDNEYKIKIGNTFNYIDILLFNIEFNCYVVIELKVIEFKKEYIGQLITYVNYIDINLRKVNQNKTIGILICKEGNEYLIKYCTDDKIIVRNYELI